MRRRPKLDANHRAIAEALSQAGCAVCSLAGVGDGVPDLLCGYIGKHGPSAAVIEVKGEKGELTPDQVKWRCWWVGPFVILRSVEEAVSWLHQAKR